MNIRKYHVGDRVKLSMKISDNPMLTIGSLGTVCISGDWVIGVYWDENINGHSCGGHCEMGHGWNVFEDEIEYAESICGEIGTPADADSLLSILYRAV